MKLTASLPWYDHPASSSTLDDFWAQMRNRLVLSGLADVPVKLNRSTPLADQWQDPGLILSQCCGPDLFTEPAENVFCLGRPVFNHLDCLPGYYYSHIVSRGNLNSNPSVAINSPTSWSGNMALQQWLVENQLGCSGIVVSGSHQNSLQLLQTGQVDIVAIDAHTWMLLDVEGVDMVGRSGLSLTPPFISGITDEQTRLVIIEALNSSISNDGNEIGIAKFLETEKSEYGSFVPELESCILRRGKIVLDCLGVQIMV